MTSRQLTLVLNSWARMSAFTECELSQNVDNKFLSFLFNKILTMWRRFNTSCSEIIRYPPAILYNLTTEATDFSLSRKQILVAIDNVYKQFKKKPCCWWKKGKYIACISRQLTIHKPVSWTYILFFVYIWIMQW